MVRGLGVNSRAVADALRQLEREGILAGQGERRRYRIVLENRTPTPTLRIALLPFHASSRGEAFNLDILRTLTEHGHNAYFTGKTLWDLQLESRRLAGMVGQKRADAWIVNSARREVLEWFAGKKLRVFALHGSFSGLPVAGIATDLAQAMLALVRRLIALGHERIVFLLYRGRVNLETARLAPMLLAEMERHGIPTNRFNLPNWRDSAKGFHDLLDLMFRQSPPTALVIEEVPHLVAALKFCGQRGIRVPEDLSVVCLEHRDELDYCWPAVTHMHWDKARMIRRIARWADRVARGREDIRQSCLKVERIEGGTIGLVGVGKNGLPNR